MRAHYWSCSKFADWLRGTAKPGAATSQGWSDWKKKAKKAHPYRFWLVEEGLSSLQNFVNYIPDKLNDVRYYAYNRWLTKGHALTAHPRDIKPGEWRDVGERFLPCLFNELVDFVECEQAWTYCVWDDEAAKKFQVPWWRKSVLRWRKWRCPEAGLERLAWAASLTGDNDEFSHQALAAQEIIKLYKWWTVERPSRPDPNEVSGWTALCAERAARRKAKRAEENDDDDDDLGGLFSNYEDEHDRLDSKKALNISGQIEKQYDTEDTEMMIRLIKIRDNLWT